MKQGAEKLKVLGLLEILRSRSDAEHGITMSEILEALSSRYEIDAERKSIYRDFDALNEAGFETEILPGSHPPAYHLLRGRDGGLTSAEMKLICDCIQSSKFLSRETTSELLGKLKNLLSEHERISLDRQIIVTNRVKSSSLSLTDNIDAITSAIAADKQIRFRYWSYDPELKHSFRKNGEDYVVSPFTLIYTDEQYYLLAYETRFKHFRVDRMEDVRIGDSAREGKEEYGKLDIESYTNYTFSMYSGSLQNVTLVFRDSLMNVVVDRFGRDIVPVRVDETHLSVSVRISVSPQFYGWLAGLGTDIRIAAPAEAADNYRRYLSGILSST